MAHVIIILVVEYIELKKARATAFVTGTGESRKIQPMPWRMRVLSLRVLFHEWCEVELLAPNAVVSDDNSA